MIVYRCTFDLIVLNSSCISLSYVIFLLGFVKLTQPDNFG
jgi:hypothetical protein